MKVEVDADLCEGYGTCLSIAPDVFELDEWGYAFVKSEDVPHGQEDLVRRATLECPMNAIRFAE
jgi:ferredoxin